MQLDYSGPSELEESIFLDPKNFMRDIKFVSKRGIQIFNEQQNSLQMVFLQVQSKRHTHNEQ